MFQRGLVPPDPFRDKGPLERAVTQDGMSLETLASMGNVLLVLLPALDRARPWLAAVAATRPRWEAEGWRLALVHQESDAGAALAVHDLQYVARIADPDRTLYRHFQLGEAKRLLGSRRQLPGLVWLERGEVAAIERPAWDQKVPMRLIATNPSDRSRP
ncbi:MAG: hypothetical protein ACYTHK_03950 [Planctomycetota bacterium]|jgi:hypothetical protein